jgi:hypothetical protein
VNDVIVIRSENPIEQLWLYLSSLESDELAKKFISERAEKSSVNLREDVLKEKAIGTAYCLRNAREYLRPPSLEWSKRILNTYYGLMSIIEAILIADPKSDYNLEKIEKATKSGHGLKNIDDETVQFPEAQKVYVTNGGLFVEYLGYRHLDTSLVKITGSAKRASDLSPSQYVSVGELLARVPEISGLYFEVTGKTPLCAEVQAYEKKSDSSTMQSEETWLELRFPSLPSLEFIEKEFCMGLGNYKEITTKGGYKHWIGKFSDEKTDSWKESIKLHKSPMVRPSWIKPVMGCIDDYLSINYMLLYALSIIVRYRPKIWRGVSEGSLNNYFALVKYYIEVISRFLPELALREISGRRVSASPLGMLSTG